MKTPLKILQHENNETVVVRANREEIAQRTMRALWLGKWRILAALVGALLLACVALVLVKPRYTAEAMIQFDFDREITGEKIQPVAVLEAAVLVEGAARLIRSRATAGAVVARLKLDEDPTFLHEPILLHWLSIAQSALGLGEAPKPTNGELAIRTLLREVAVRSEPRSYLISIEVTAEDPERAAELSNAVAMEYLRNQSSQRLAEAQARAEREMANTALIYGDRHPNFLRVQEKLKRIEEDSVDPDRQVTSDFGLEMSQSLITADVAAIPSVPNINLTLALAAIAGLIVGVWLALRGQGADGRQAQMRRSSSDPNMSSRQVMG